MGDRFFAKNKGRIVNAEAFKKPLYEAITNEPVNTLNALKIFNLMPPLSKLEIFL